MSNRSRRLRRLEYAEATGVMDEYEFRAEQLRDPALRDILTLIVTAGAVTPRVEALGAEAILRKPVTARQLVDAVSPFC